MKKLLIATKNRGKIKEYKEFLSDLDVKLVSLSDVGISDEYEETGNSYEENSEGKALFYAKKSGLPSISDDGGIELDGLDGAPGIKSRRYFGKNRKEATDEEIIEAMTKLSKQLPENKRGARFVLVVSFVLPQGKVWSQRGVVEGIITEKPLMKLSKGYPYRSFFYLPKLGKYYFESELTKDEMKEYNHRYRAIQNLKEIIKKKLGLSF